MSTITNARGTSSPIFSIERMVLEHVSDGGNNDGLKLTFPGYSPVYIRARDPLQASKWLTGDDPPEAADGNPSDFWLQTNGDVYTKEDNTTWVFVSSFVGPTGPTGPTGGVGATGPAGPSAAISSASDVQITSIQDGDILRWSSGSSKFVNTPLNIDGGFF